MKVTPVALIADGREIARFGESGYEFPWLDAPLRGLSRKHRDWLADVSGFNAEMDVAEAGGTMDDAAEEELWHRRRSELRLTDRDFEIFSEMSVRFSDGSVHRIGMVHFEDDHLRWRNGEELEGEAAAARPALTNTNMLIATCKGLLEGFLIELLCFVVFFGALFAWAAGWFG